MMPSAASVLNAARAKFWDSISSASSRRRSSPRRIASLIIDGKSRCFRQPARQLVDRGLEVRWANSAIDPAHRLRLLRGEPGRLDDVALGARLADQAWQPLRAAGTGDDSE